MAESFQSTENVQDNSNDTTNSSLTCELCGKLFNHVRYMNRHNNQFHKEKKASVLETSSMDDKSSDDVKTNELPEDVNNELKIEEVPVIRSIKINDIDSLTNGNANTYCCFTNETEEDYPVYVLVNESTDKKNENPSNMINIQNSNPNAIDQSLLQSAPIFCKLCNVKFTNVSYLKRHANRFHVNMNLESLIDKSKLKVAQAKPAGNLKKYSIMKKSTESSKSKPSPYDDGIWSSCDTCDKKFNNPLQLKMHKQKGCLLSKEISNDGNSNGRFSEESNETDNDPTNRKRKVEQNSNNISIQKKAKFDNHLTMASLNSKSVCDLCGKVLPGEAYLLRHYNKMHPNEENNQAVFSCEFCSKKFVSAFTFKRHKINNHASLLKSKTQNEEQDVSVKNSMCPICNKRFTNDSYMLRHHNRFHPNEDFLSKNYICDICNQNFLSLKSYQRHIRKHEHDSIIQVDQTGCQYERMSTINNEASESVTDQTEIENGQQSIVDTNNDSNSVVRCKHCNSSFSSERYLLRHCNKYHRDDENIEAAYKCEKCNKSFGKKSSWQNHKSCGLLPSEASITLDTANKPHEVSRKEAGSEIEKNEEDSADIQDNLKQKSNENSLENSDESLERDFKCDLCKAMFSKRQFLTWHKNRFHKPADSETDVDDEKPPEPNEQNNVENSDSNVSASQATTGDFQNGSDKSNEKSNANELQNNVQSPAKENNENKIENSKSEDKILLSVYECPYCKEFFDSPYLLSCHHKRRHQHLVYNKNPKKQAKYVSIMSEQPNDHNIVFCHLCKKTFNHQQYLTRHNNKYHSESLKASDNKISKDQIHDVEYTRSDGTFVITEEQKNELNKISHDLKRVSDSINKMNKDITNLSTAKQKMVINLDDMLKELSTMRHSIDNMENKIKVYNTTEEVNNDESTMENDITFTVSFEQNEQMFDDDNTHAETKQKEVFPCLYCDKLFNKLPYLHRHQNRFHSDKVSTPYKCSHCNVYFNQKVVMTNHMRRFHSDKQSTSTNRGTTVTKNTNEVRTTGNNDNNRSIVAVDGQEQGTNIQGVETNMTVKTYVGRNNGLNGDTGSELSVTDADVDGLHDTNKNVSSNTPVDTSVEMAMHEIENAVLQFVDIADCQNENGENSLGNKLPDITDESAEISKPKESEKNDSTSIVILGHDGTFNIDRF